MVIKSIQTVHTSAHTCELLKNVTHIPRLGTFSTNKFLYAFVPCLVIDYTDLVNAKTSNDTSIPHKCQSLLPFVQGLHTERYSVTNHLFLPILPFLVTGLIFICRAASFFYFNHV